MSHLNFQEQDAKYDESSKQNKNIQISDKLEASHGGFNKFSIEILLTNGKFTHAVSTF